MPSNSQSVISYDKVDEVVFDEYILWIHQYDQSAVIDQYNAEVVYPLASFALSNSITQLYNQLVIRIASKNQLPSLNAIRHVWKKNQMDSLLGKFICKIIFDNCLALHNQAGGSLEHLNGRSHALAAIFEEFPDIKQKCFELLLKRDHGGPCTYHDHSFTGKIHGGRESPSADQLGCPFTRYYHPIAYEDDSILRGQSDRDPTTTPESARHGVLQGGLRNASNFSRTPREVPTVYAMDTQLSNRDQARRPTLSRSIFLPRGNDDYCWGAPDEEFEDPDPFEAMQPQPQSLPYPTGYANLLAAYRAQERYLLSNPAPAGVAANIETGRLRPRRTGQLRLLNLPNFNVEFTQSQPTRPESLPPIDDSINAPEDITDQTSLQANPRSPSSSSPKVPPARPSKRLADAPSPERPQAGERAATQRRSTPKTARIDSEES